ncbi:MAG: flagellar protein FlaG [Syntrophales bacterium]
MDMAISNINMAGPAGSAITLPGSGAGNSPAQASQEPTPISGKAADQLLQQIQGHMESTNISLSFSKYGNNDDEIAVIVKDKDTGKVIREIPPKDIQDLRTKIGELIGLIFNHSV